MSLFLGHLYCYIKYILWFERKLDFGTITPDYLAKSTYISTGPRNPPPSPSLNWLGWFKEHKFFKGSQQKSPIG